MLRLEVCRDIHVDSRRRISLVPVSSEQVTTCCGNIRTMIAMRDRNLVKLAFRSIRRCVELFDLQQCLLAY